MFKFTVFSSQARKANNIIKNNLILLIGGVCTYNVNQFSVDYSEDSLLLSGLFDKASIPFFIDINL